MARALALGLALTICAGGVACGGDGADGAIATGDPAGGDRAGPPTPSGDNRLSATLRGEGVDAAIEGQWSFVIPTEWGATVTADGVAQFWASADNGSFLSFRVDTAQIPLPATVTVGEASSPASLSVSLTDPAVLGFDVFGSTAQSTGDVVVHHCPIEGGAVVIDFDQVTLRGPGSKKTLTFDGRASLLVGERQGDATCSPDWDPSVLDAPVCELVPCDGPCCEFQSCAAGCEAGCRLETCIGSDDATCRSCLRACWSGDGCAPTDACVAALTPLWTCEDAACADASPTDGVCRQEQCCSELGAAF